MREGPPIMTHVASAPVRSCYSTSNILQFDREVNACSKGKRQQCERRNARNICLFLYGGIWIKAPEAVVVQV